MNKYDIHSDFKNSKNFPIPFSPRIIEIGNFFINRSFNITRNNSEIREVKKIIKGYKNKDIEVKIFEPKNIVDNAPCLIYLHGGGFALEAGPIHKKLINEYALKIPCKVIFVKYRLSSKEHFPVGVEDCYSACQWAYDNYKELGINKDKIAICGDSAGGGLAAAVCLMANDRKTFKVCFQMLIYPVTDARMTTESMKKYIDTPMWNSKLNRKMWDLYLKDGISTKREYASPMEAVSLNGLPNTYIEVAEFDCLRDEGIAYAERLKKAGVRVQFYKIDGSVHGFEFAEKSKIVIKIIERRIEALKRAFGY